MSQYVIDTKIYKGNISLKNIPLSDDTAVKVIVISKVELKTLYFDKIQKLTRSISGNLSDNIMEERN